MGKRVRSKVCASVSAPSLAEMQRKAERALELGSDLVEFRVDALAGRVEPEEVASKLRRFAGAAVFTVRSKREGGGFSGDERARLGLMSRLAELRPAYMDVELSTATENERWLGSLPGTVKKIVSWHDFHGTPDMSTLRKTCERELERGSVAKVVTTATKVEDNLSTVRLCSENPGKVVSFCMGELGAVSRVMSMGARAPLVYAALPHDAVAPGQLSIPTMLEFRGLLFSDD